MLALVRPYLAEAPNANSVKIAVDTRLVVVHAGFDQPIRVVLYRGAEMLGQVQLMADQATAIAADLLQAAVAAHTLQS